MKCLKHFRTKPIHILTCVVLLTALPFLSYAQPPNDACGSAQTLTSAPTCGNVLGTLKNNTTNVNATATASINAFCGQTTSADVWYVFQAQTTLPTIQLSSMGTSMRVAPRLQLFNTTSCAPATLNANSNTCVSGSNTTTLNLTPSTPLTVGTFYLVRVFTNNTVSGTASTWNFNICIVDPAPANDLCSNAVTLTSGTSCGGVTGNVYASTVSTTTITAPDCAGTVTYDVWYKFIAATTNPQIQLNSIGAGFAGAEMQLLSNNCGGTFTNYDCGTNVINANYLSPGTTYFIRVYSNGSAPTGGTNTGFSICVVDPVNTSVPFNDNICNAINLPIWNTCNNIGGDVTGATASPQAIGACSGPVAYDVWYKFTSINTSATITLSSIGAGFASPNLQMFSYTTAPTCAGYKFTSIGCGTSPLTVSTLTAGTVYYVRVYSTSGPSPNGNGRFNICATTTSAPIRYGNSYVNITRKTTGGVVQKDDTLEIRFTVNHTNNTMYAMRYVDNLPTKTKMAITAPHDSIRIITNEGLTYKKYTLANDLDQGTYLASPPLNNYNVRVNLGFGSAFSLKPADNTATEVASATGQMNAATDRPKGGGGMLFAIAYRVVVTGNTGDTITLNPGRFIYRTAPGGTDITLLGTAFKIIISDPLTLCNNSTGVNNADEFGGTFGTGSTLNRPSDLSAPIAGYTFIPDVSAYTGVGDGRYAIVKNLSPRSSTNTIARRQNTCATPTALMPNDVNSCNNRMFGGFWYIAGDHSGTSNAAGNLPPAPATNSGYMLMVNADYVASEIYRQGISNLCANTYYEFSAWVKNICPNCGIDSAGVSTYKPGVYPNLSFSLNNVDYYSTGEIDTLGWQKKGFVFKTVLGQTNAVFSIRNNSQGGGGNDWVLDDIAVATCFPNMTYSPTSNPTICANNSIIIADTVRSYFDNYKEYKWQKSTDGGANWVDIPFTSGTATLTYNGTYYQFISTYTIPPSQTTAANQGDMYRLVVASTTGNLAGADCSYSDPTTITLTVLTDCGPVLGVDFMSITGRMNANKSIINWTTSKEDQPVSYTIEKSTNGVNFAPIGTVNGHNNLASITNDYTFNDPVAISGKVYYRVVMTINQSTKKYSRIIQLNTGVDGFVFGAVVNPFSNELQYEINSPVSGMIRVELIDGYGRLVKSENQRVSIGSNNLSISNTGTIAEGTYVLKAYLNDNVIFRRVMKKEK